LPQTTEPKYLRTAQVAELLQVSPKTVSRWAQEGRLPYVRTLGGHRPLPQPADPGPAENPVRAIPGRLAARLA
jgi:excisionase family DNA binding protein